jgi:hypothetical protein
VQAPDNNVKKTTELHVRKVRDVETGGMPTSLDEPLTFTMDASMTAFRSNSTGEKLFQPIGHEFSNYKTFKISPNNGFLNK